MRCVHGFGAKTWVLLIAAGCLPIVGCGGRANRNDLAGGARGGEASGGGSGGAASTEGGSGGAVDEPPQPVDPEVSRAWTWQPCGTLLPEPADSAALFDSSGQIVVLGARGVRVYDSSGAQVESFAGDAEFLVNAEDGSVLTGRRTSAGIELTPVGASAPSVVLPRAPNGACESVFSTSADGAYLLATGENVGCAWRVADASFVGSVAGEQVTIRDSRFVTVERGASVDVVQRDFSGTELSRRAFGDGPVLLSPAGDRAVTLGKALVDLDSGDVLPWDAAPQKVFAPPLFSSGGDAVWLGDGVFRASDGARLYSIGPSSRVAMSGGRSRQLASDGSRVVSYGGARATLYDVEAEGILAMLGPPVAPDPERSLGITDLAISRDGSVLVYNIQGVAAFGVRPAPRFGDSQVLWDMRVEVNLSVDVSTDGRLVSVGGDGRATVDARDGQALWPSEPPPPIVSIDEVCLLDLLRFSPKGTWLAGSDYSFNLQIFGTNSVEPWKPLLELPGDCDAAVFSRDERLMATSAAALYRTGASSADWTPVWSSPVPKTRAALSFVSSDVDFSPDETQLLVTSCTRPDGGCTATLLDAKTGAVTRKLPELSGPHPAFSPEGSWIIAANQLLHLPSGETRSLAEDASPNHPAIFTPDGDIIAGSADGALTRYCREE